MGNYKLWHKLIKLLFSISTIKMLRLGIKNKMAVSGLQVFVKFIHGVLKTFPLDIPIESDSNEITLTEKKFEYLNTDSTLVCKTSQQRL